jgi:hypothetical protein
MTIFFYTNLGKSIRKVFKKVRRTETLVAATTAENLYDSPTVLKITNIGEQCFDYNYSSINHECKFEKEKKTNSRRPASLLFILYCRIVYYTLLELWFFLLRSL